MYTEASKLMMAVQAARATSAMIATYLEYMDPKLQRACGLTVEETHEICAHAIDQAERLEAAADKVAKFLEATDPLS